jgi:hypothetical protein
LIDFAAAEPAAEVVDPVAAEVVDPAAEVVDPAAEVVDPAAAGKETETHNVDGSEKSAEEQESFKTKAAAAAKTAASDKLIDTKATPDNVRKALKAMRDASPANGAVVKELHGAFERWNAAKAVFPNGVQEMQEAKDFIASIGGTEGYEKLNNMVEAVKASDELLYTSDPQLWKNVVEDIKTAGHPEALGQLAPSFMSTLKEHDADAYYGVTKPIFFEGLIESRMDGMVQSLNNALNAKDAEGKPAPDVATLKALIQNPGGLTEWFKGLQAEDANKKKVVEDTPERKKFLAEKAEFEKSKTADGQAKIKAFEESVATDAEHYNNRTLGAAFAPFLRMAYFKDFPRETKVDIGNGIKERLYATLKADKGYQAQMAAFWKKGNTPENKAAIAVYHNGKIDSIANEIVTKTIQTKYPGYAKGGSAAGRVAAAAVKKTATTTASAQSVSSGKPIYVATRPTNLIRDEVKIGERTYSSSDLITMQIAGRGFVKGTDGKSFRLVTWRK